VCTTTVRSELVNGCGAMIIRKKAAQAMRCKH
jgi:hypothetical protein